ARPTSREQEKSIALSTTGILFLGTPHRGGRGTGMGLFLAQVGSLFTHTSSGILKHLAENSEWLQMQQGQFSDVSADFEIKFFYETFAMKIPIYGHVLIVPKYSAVVPETPNAEEIPIEADHRHMVKYNSLNDENFRKVASRLVTMTKSARKRVVRKWESWQRVKCRRLPSDNLLQLMSPPAAAIHHTSDYYENIAQRKQFQIPTEVKHWRNKKFVGREDILSQLSTKLFTFSSRETEVVVLHGTGGVGKTQIALEFAWRHESSFDGIFWFDGTSEQTVINGMRDAISRIVLHYEFLGLKNDPIYSILQDSLPERDGKSFNAIRARQIFHKWLSSDPVNTWLLVFDNVDDLESFNIKDFIPMPFGSKILVTSRRPDLGLAYPSAQITELTEHDGLKMIEKYAGITLVPGSQGMTNSNAHSTSSPRVLTRINKRA
ncbi:P-loop containing nucleoside triphosphate hydrolase protein, partial [Hyaloscypha sp. PMI_1271]